MAMAESIFTVIYSPSHFSFYLLHKIFLSVEFVNALGEPGTEDSYDDEDEEIAGY